MIMQMVALNLKHRTNRKDRQAFTNCMHSYDHARDMHANFNTCAQKCVHGIDWEHNWELFITFPDRPLCFKKIRTTTLQHF